MGWISLTVAPSDLARELQADGAVTADIINEIADRLGGHAIEDDWICETAEELNTDGERLILGLAAAIEAAKEGAP